MGGPRWKREVFPDHKFDFIDVKSFTAHGFLLWFGYAWVFLETLKSLGVYVLDTQTGPANNLKRLTVAIFLLAFNRWASQVQPAISLSISRWIFSGCIIFSFLLLVKDWWTARKIIRSRDISFAYTNLIGIVKGECADIANRWFCIRAGYSYFCLFDKLGESRHVWDSIAFFVFFTFKGTVHTRVGANSGWKRLILAEGPRQVLNAITLYSVAKDQNFSFDVSRYQKVFSTVQGVVMSFMLLTVLIWALSAIRLAVAFFLYWPLLVCHIRGNLKEYCCHKVDKRITQILSDRSRQRRNGTLKPEKTTTETPTATPDVPGTKPTLPKVEIDGDGGSIISMPLYPLTRTNTSDSTRGLLRSDSAMSIAPPYLSRTTTSSSLDSRMPAPGRQPTLPHLLAEFAVPEVPKPGLTRSPPPSRSESLGSAGQMSITQGPGPVGPQRNPSLPREQVRSPEMGFRPPVRSNTAQTIDSSRPPTRQDAYAPPSRQDQYPPPSRQNSNPPTRPDNYGAPTRSNTDQFRPATRQDRPATRQDNYSHPVGRQPTYPPPSRQDSPASNRSNAYGPPMRSNTEQYPATSRQESPAPNRPNGYGPPTRSNTDQYVAPSRQESPAPNRTNGYGPPPRSNTDQFPPPSRRESPPTNRPNGYGPLARSHTDQLPPPSRQESPAPNRPNGYGPPPRSNTDQYRPATRQDARSPMRLDDAGQSDFRAPGRSNTVQNMDGPRPRELNNGPGRGGTFSSGRI
jgi:Fungal potassium channel